MFLGNLTIEQIESDDYGHSFKFTDEEREYLKKHHHPKASFDSDSSGWHMFDLPRFLQISHDDVGKHVLEIFQSHSDEMVGQIQVGYAPETIKEV